MQDQKYAHSATLGRSWVSAREPRARVHGEGSTIAGSPAIAGAAPVDNRVEQSHLGKRQNVSTFTRSEASVLLNVKARSCKPRPESDLDCLVCADFQRCRCRRSAGAGSPAPTEPSGFAVQTWQLLKGKRTCPYFTRPSPSREREREARERQQVTRGERQTGRAVDLG